MKSKSISLNQKLTEVDLSVRVINSLRGADVHTIRDLVPYKKMELLRFRNLGMKSLREIEDFYDDYGLSFGMNILPDVGLKRKAVEWQFYELHELENEEIHSQEYSRRKNQILQQSKELEKERIINFAFNYLLHGFNNDGELPPVEEFYDNFFTQ
jgi:hypothetical protein